ncbi:MAG: SEC-C domain-containing protein [Chitinivibrionales bacterium]|nr:SEC-C domain-containing protein [Chitinivibrionales bacterium]
MQHIENYVSDFFSSSHQSFIPAVIRPHAESVLNQFCAWIQQQPDQAVTYDALQQFLFSPIAQSSMDMESKKAVAQLLECFFSYLSDSGNVPSAANWSIDLALAASTFTSRLRDDGTLRGETFQKKYTDVGRNDPCPCGSGKKFKKCCQKLIDGNGSAETNG